MVLHLLWTSGMIDLVLILLVLRESNSPSPSYGNLSVNQLTFRVLASIDV